MDDATRRDEELEALRAIYGDTEVTGMPGSLSWIIRIGNGACLEVHCPYDYPSASAPTPVICVAGMSEEQVRTLLSHCHVRSHTLPRV